MKGVHFVVMTTLATCFLATSVQSITCYECWSDYDADPDCIDPDIMKILGNDHIIKHDSCTSCTVKAVSEEIYERECLYELPEKQDPPEQYSTDCSGVIGVVCWCNTDLCNGKGGTITHKSRTTTIRTTSVASSETSTGGGKGNRHTKKPSGSTISGEQKTASSRVLIAAVTTAMLSLA